MWSEQHGAAYALYRVLRLFLPCEILDVTRCKMKISDSTAQFHGIIIALWKSGS